MKQSMLAVLLSVMLLVTGVFCADTNVKAEEAGEDMDYSYLLTDDALIGYAQMQTRGVYLAEGYSIINKISTTKIGAGGVTNAAVKCEVTVTPIVERQTSTGWAFVTCWTQTNENAFSAMVSKSLTVGTGYWYRVRSTHYASTDRSSSCTDALWM